MTPAMSEWTVDTLKEYLADLLQQQEKRYTERFDGQDKAVQAALAAADKAVQAAFAGAEKAINKEEKNAELWRQSANEWRAAMNDRESKFALGSKVDDMARRLEQFALASKLEDLAARVDKQEGRSTGLNASWSLLVGAVALIGVIVTIFLNVR